MTSQAPPIYFHYQVGNFYFPQRTALKIFLNNYVAGLGRSIQAINIIFCTDEEILRINREYLDHDYYTDIITFELSEKKQPLIADIFISKERVLENAVEFQSSFTSELHRVIFHGFLHLLGYSDKTKKATELMRMKEAELLHLYFRK